MKAGLEFAIPAAVEAKSAFETIKDFDSILDEPPELDTAELGNEKIMALLGIDMKALGEENVQKANILGKIGVFSLLKGFTAIKDIYGAMKGGPGTTLKAVESTLKFASHLDPTGIADLILVFIHPRC